MVLTGLRSHELCELKLSDVDFDNDQIVVRLPDGTVDRNIPLTELAHVIVKNYLDKQIRPLWVNSNDYLFGTITTVDINGVYGASKHWRQFNRSTLSRLVHQYGQAVLQKDINPQALRDCTTYLWHTIGSDMESISKIVGHKNARSTHTQFEKILEAITTDAKVEFGVNKQN